MTITQPIAAAIIMIGTLTSSVAGAQERVPISNINLSERSIGQLPGAVRGSISEPEWVVSPSPQWPDEAGDIAEQVTVTSECSVSKGGSMRGCRITSESIVGKGFGQSFLHALAKAKVETNSYRSDDIVFRATVTFEPPVIDQSRSQWSSVAP